MRLSFTSRLSIFYFIIAIGMAVLTYDTYKISKQNIKDHQWVSQTHDVLLTLTRVRALTKDNALYSSQYIITGDTNLLRVINYQKNIIYDRVDDLLSMTKDNIKQQKKYSY